MSLAPGTRFGPYEILGAIGAGGMGEVYRARDARLNRDVAIKVLPAGFSADPDRLRRFEQEARATAALNHPNILAVHDIGTGDDAPYIVSELLDGETLREAMAAGALPMLKAVDYAREVAAGLAAAHVKGITHRDIKPENLFVTADGRVKILDFGLAKLREQRSSGTSETREAASTDPGAVLGTVAYMSPEQVRGQAADPRSDMFSLGVVLFEMLAGARPFQRDSAADTMSAILKEDPPDLVAANSKLPPALDRIVRHCLEKNPGERFQSAQDLGFALASLSTMSDSSAARAMLAEGQRPKRALAGWRIATALCLIALAVTAPFTVQHLREVAPATKAVRFLLPAPVRLAPTVAPAISPDGRTIAFAGVTARGRSLWVRPLDDLGARELPEFPMTGTSPFWSPDSRFIGFGALSGQLARIDAAGGMPQTICEGVGAIMGGAWNRAGVIVFSRRGQGLFRVPATGGTPVAITTLDPSLKDTDHLAPAFLPDERHVLYVSRSGTPERAGVYIASLDGGTPTRLLDSGDRAAYAEPGYLLVARAGRLLAQRFDPDRLALTGEPIPVEEGLRAAAFSVSRDNTLLFANRTQADAQFVWFGRDGRQGAALGDPDLYSTGLWATFDLSRDGARVVLPREDPQTGNLNLWTVDVVRGLTARVTLGAFDEVDPRWSPDGKEILFGSTRSSSRAPFRLPASGGEASRAMPSWSGRAISLDDWSPDGRVALYHDAAAHDLWSAPVEGDEKPLLVVRTLSGTVDQARFSPDGRWVAYNANDSGRFEVYVVPFPPTDEKWQISTAGGVQPMWRADGKELFYLTLDGVMTAVDIKAGRRVEAGIPRPLFRTQLASVSYLTEDYAVTGDGQRFLIRTPVAGAAPPSMTVMLNWVALVKK